MRGNESINEKQELGNESIIIQKDEDVNQKEKLTRKSKPLNRKKNIQTILFQGYPCG